MRIFIAACITAGLLGVIGAIALSYVQEPVKVAFSTEGVRVD
jgi:hypothetical protein